jgi:hypothetical protein
MTASGRTRQPRQKPRRRNRNALPFSDAFINDFRRQPVEIQVLNLRLLAWHFHFDDAGAGLSATQRARRYYVNDEQRAWDDHFAAEITVRSLTKTKA